MINVLLAFGFAGGEGTEESDEENNWDEMVSFHFVRGFVACTNIVFLMAGSKKTNAMTVVVNSKARMFSAKTRMFDAKARMFSAKARIFDAKARMFSAKARMFSAKARMFSAKARMFSAMTRMFYAKTRMFDAKARMFSAKARMFSAKTRMFKKVCQLFALRLQIRASGGWQKSKSFKGLAFTKPGSLGKRVQGYFEAEMKRCLLLKSGERRMLV
ncbi:MAG TPA: hypothetical protein PLA77_09895 [Bacteroidales bacterium]|nr:hypothetical protein [Bacteroidales bacterium]